MTPDKCSKCGAPKHPAPFNRDELMYVCGSLVSLEKGEVQSYVCIKAERDQLAARVKRLEEAGDFMELCLTGHEPFRTDAKRRWTKAKEAQP